MLQRGQWQFLLPALVVGANLAHAILPGPRWSQGCASVNRVLYCYGGSAGSYSDGTPHIYNDMYKLDFMTNLDVSDLSVSWDSVNLSSQPNPGYNWEMAIAASQELGILVMDGGSGKQDGVPLTYQTMIYHVSNGTWEAISNDVSPLQMHQEPMVTVNDTKMYRWSGFAKMQLGVPQPNNGTIWADNRMFVLDLLTKSWSAISPQNVGNIPIRTGHSATLSPDGNSIYYFGGLDMVPVTDAAGKTTYQTPVADMLNVLVYNTITTQFQTVRGTGDKPTNRTLATTTLSK
ncbi:hypothetical protein BCR43DRAFT_60658 [Syncephalastrum racemosum]|uniref:Galactose oxidase n=1 Tax=Syncephalastrum racemosum TaxID=13706 RepID=A0A1X2HW30_SYNRA|nr:hypothetical protein BCR43DRAFT_60658 [Syncephalastrum racemosum]